MAPMQRTWIFCFFEQRLSRNCTLVTASPEQMLWKDCSGAMVKMDSGSGQGSDLDGRQVGEESLWSRVYCDLTCLPITRKAAFVPLHLSEDQWVSKKEGNKLQFHGFGRGLYDETDPVACGCNCPLDIEKPSNNAWVGNLLPLTPFLMINSIIS